MDAELYRIAILLLSITIVALQDPPSGCIKEEFSCNDGTCISDRLLCNDIDDCSNGLDEFVCIERSGLGCPPNTRQCGDNPNECISLVKLCDGIYDCQNREDESSCQLRPNSSCLISEFECPFLGGILTNPLQNDCIPIAHQCDGIQHCADGGDETGCSPPIISTEPVSIMNAHHGSSPSLMCVAEGTPTPTITWLKNLLPLTPDPRLVVVSEEGMGVLLIKNATLLDEGQYSCVATNPLGTSVTSRNRTNLRISNTNPFICTDMNDNLYTEGDQFYNIEIMTFGDAVSAAADIVFVVDETGSMQDAHEWIRMTIPLLEQALKDENIGIGLRDNLFALVGFGREMVPENEGILLTDLTSVEGFLNASQKLVADGVLEDGYSGIDFALDQVSLRDESMRIMVFVSNDARYPLPGKRNITRNVIEQRLIDKHFVLNSVVNQEILYDKNNARSFAFALQANRTVYSFTSLTEFMESSNGVASRSNDSTYEDYTRLALNLGGAVFDINQIQNGESILVPFLDVFVKVKVDEVVGSNRRCLNCLCVEPAANGQCRVDFSIDITNCTGSAPAESFLTVSVSPAAPEVIEGNNLTLTCDIIVSPPNTNVEIVWKFMFVVMICDLQNVECIGNTITIRNFTIENDGFYSCEVSTLADLAFDLTMTSFKSPPMANITAGVSQINQGKPLFLTCSTTGIPTPSIIWRRTNSSQPIPNTLQSRVTVDTSRIGEVVTSELVIDPVEIEDAGSYECVAINSAGNDTDTITVNVFFTECTLTNGSVLPVNDQVILFITNNVNHSADVILVVDESGSMNTEHQWIINMTRRLDEVLQELNIGRNVSNMFGLTGFGSFKYTNGRIVTYNGRSFFEANEVDKLIAMLQVSGREEDGYLALKFAIDNYEFRSNAVKQFILITDEERDILETGLNKTNILNMIEDSQLSGVVSEGFESVDSIPAIGMDSNGNAYVYDPLSPNLIRLVIGGARPIKDTSYATTNEDYTDLVLSSEGSIWDLLLLRQGGQVAEAFTEAFVQATIEGIYRRLSRCMNCTCTTSGRLSCIRLNEYNDIPECNITEVLLSVLPKMSQPSPSIPVAVAPSIQRHLSGLGTAQLVCTIEDGTEGTFVWTFNGGQLFTENVQVSTTACSSTLRIMPVLHEHSGRYACLVRRNNEIGGDTGFIEISELQSPLGVVVMEPEITVTVGQNVSFTCSSNEQVTFEWRFNQETSLPSNVFVENNMDTSVLTVTNAMRSNIGRYFCTGQRSMSLLTDKDFAKLYVYTPLLMITVNPSSHVIIDVGSNVTLTCNLDCFCSGASLSWRRGFNGTLPDNAQVTYNSDRTQAVLQLQNVQLQDCDQYICVGEFGDQTQQIGTNVVPRESETFEVTLNTNSSISAIIGSNQTFICSSNIFVSNWTWLFNNSTDLPLSVEQFYLTDSKRTILVICGIEQFHAGSYECKGVSINNDIASDISQLQVITADNETSTISQDMMTSSVSDMSIIATSTITETADSQSLSSSFESASSTISMSNPMSSDGGQFVTMTSDAMQSPSSMILSPSDAMQSPSSMILISPSDPMQSPSSMILSPSDAMQSPSSMILSPSDAMQSPSSMILISPSEAMQSPSSMILSPSDAMQSPSSMILSPSDAMQSPRSMILISPSEAMQSPSSMILISPSEAMQSPSSMILSPSDAIQSPSSMILISPSDAMQSPSSMILISPSDAIQSTSSMLLSPSDAMPSPSSMIISPSDAMQSPSSMILISPSDAMPSPSSMLLSPSDMMFFSSDIVLSPSDTIQSPSSMILSPSQSSSPSDTMSIASSSIINSQTFPTTSTMMPRPVNLMTPQVSVNELRLSPGANASITCTSNTPAKLNWILTGATSLPDNVMSKQTSNTTAVLTIVNFNGESDRGSYNCLAEANGRKQGVIVPVNPVEMLALTISMRTVTVATSNDPTTNDDIEITCRLNCGCGGASVEWKFGPDQGRIPDGVTTMVSFSRRTATLIFSDITLELAGDYVCIAELNTAPDIVQDNFTLVVLEPAMLTVDPSQITVPAGEDVNFTCITNREAIIEWFYETEDGELPENAVSEKINSTAEKLVIMDVADNNGNTGQFFCVALFPVTNEMRSRTVNVFQKSVLQLRFDPPMENNSYTFPVGDAISIRCRVACTCGGAMAEWSSPLPSGLTATPSFSGRSNQLSTSSAQLEHAGEYVCRVFLSDDSITETIQIIVVA